MANTIKQSTLTRAEDGTITLHIKIPQTDVKKATEEVMADTVKTADMKGFRKGKAPKKLVEESTDPAKLREEVLKRLLPKYYMETVQAENLRPIVNPKIHVDKLDDGSDWEFTATTAEMPDVKLGKYKEAVKALTAKSKIVVPGKEEKPTPVEEILKIVADNTTATVPSIMAEAEADKHLAQTLDEIKKLGLTLDQYLQSTGKTPNDLRAEYEKKAAEELKLEFALAKIADDEKIQVQPEEIEKTIEGAQNPQEKANMQANRYLIASFLRQQKTLAFLKSL